MGKVFLLLVMGQVQAEYSTMFMESMLYIKEYIVYQVLISILIFYIIIFVIYFLLKWIKEVLSQPFLQFDCQCWRVSLLYYPQRMKRIK